MYALCRDCNLECVVPAVPLVCHFSEDQVICSGYKPPDDSSRHETPADLWFLLNKTVLKTNYFCLWNYSHDKQCFLLDFEELDAFVLQHFTSSLLLCHLSGFLLM